MGRFVNHILHSFYRDYTLSVHINKAIAKADRRFNIIRRCQKILPRSCKEMLYRTTIRPVLDYGDIIYDACFKSESGAIENVNVKQLLYVQALSDIQVTNA